MIRDVATALIRQVLRVPFAWEAVLLASNLRNRNVPWLQHHPLDAHYGVRTAGYVPTWMLGADGEAARYAVVYAGCQPSCLRHALADIPDLERCSFLDLGCGKGRALIVASEYSFRAIIGVELSAKTARTAAANARLIGTKFRSRTSIEVRIGDATTAALPTGDLVVFLYHPFTGPLFARMLETLRSALDQEERRLFVVYQNPVCAEMIDTDRRFVRWTSAVVPCHAGERGTSFVDGEAVVVWRAGLDAPPQSRQQPSHQIVPLGRDQVTLR